MDDDIVSRAKKFAEHNGTSISEIVEIYLNTISNRPGVDHIHSPLFESIRGILKSADMEDYREQYRGHLARKHL